MLLAGDDNVLSVLREQAKQATVRSREMTGVGFFTYFSVPPKAPRIPGTPKFQLTDVHGTADNVMHGVGFVLFVKDRALLLLEGFTYDEPWPGEITGLKLAYSGGANRDMEEVRRELHKP